jgi:hypothetical protein
MVDRYRVNLKYSGPCGVRKQPDKLMTLYSSMVFVKAFVYLRDFHDRNESNTMKVCCAVDAAVFESIYCR